MNSLDHITDDMIEGGSPAWMMKAILLSKIASIAFSCYICILIAFGKDQN